MKRAVHIFRATQKRSLTFNIQLFIVTSYCCCCCFFCWLFVCRRSPSRSLLFIKSQLVQVHAPSSCQRISTHCTILQPHTIEKQWRNEEKNTHTHRRPKQKTIFVSMCMCVCVPELKKSECVRKLHPFFLADQLFVVFRLLSSWPTSQNYYAVIIHTRRNTHTHIHGICQSENC